MNLEEIYRSRSLIRALRISEDNSKKHQTSTQGKRKSKTTNQRKGAR